MQSFAFGIQRVRPMCLSDEGYLIQIPRKPPVDRGCCFGPVSLSATNAADIGINSPFDHVPKSHEDHTREGANEHARGWMGDLVGTMTDASRLRRCTQYTLLRTHQNMSRTQPAQRSTDDETKTSRPNEGTKELNLSWIHTVNGRMTDNYRLGGVCGN